MLHHKAGKLPLQEALKIYVPKVKIVSLMYIEQVVRMIDDIETLTIVINNNYKAM